MGTDDCFSSTGVRQGSGASIFHVFTSLCRHAGKIIDWYLCVCDMMQICREQFVTLHNEPILSDLAEFPENKFGELT